MRLLFAQTGIRFAIFTALSVEWPLFFGVRGRFCLRARHLSPEWQLFLYFVGDFFTHTCHLGLEWPLFFALLVVFTRERNLSLECPLFSP